MATVSGGSKPTFTVDQVLHAVEMNQLNQEWIVDSVPSASAGKNGDVVFVTTKGGVWAKVSGSWVQASLSSADMQSLQDQIDALGSYSYNDSWIQPALDGKADDPHTHSEYQAAGDYATNTDLTTGLAGKADDPHTHADLAADDHTHAEYQAAGDYATNDALTTGLGGKSDTDHVHIQEGSGLTFDPSREGQIVQSTNGTDWVAGMSIRVVNAVPDDTEGEIGDVVFVVGS